MRFLCLAAAITAIIAPTAASAQRIIAAPAEIELRLKAAGMDAVEQTDGAGDPALAASWNDENFIVFFYGCSGHRDCRSIQFHYVGADGTPFDADAANTWNSIVMFGRASLDKSGRPTLDMDVDLDGEGAPPSLFADEIDKWKMLLDGFISANAKAAAEQRAGS